MNFLLARGWQLLAAQGRHRVGVGLFLERAYGRNSNEKSIRVLACYRRARAALDYSPVTSLDTIIRLVGVLTSAASASLPRARSLFSTVAPPPDSLM